ncbi:P-loop containing nucleoside triphosphate hydrolase protein [Cercophora newfieldiana]|uniref:P-loop containing nucleoside triphosphate hydrolase protein n=1 Tax=Cercophora newfieldiana TaxID=92897 RepID=A0AA39XSM9_9PEZI|nr:P-loop containing nucleoside triphosphate hydrolase protein [Cercophora newfieldiana]
MASPVTLLLIGPTGSGKSSFVKRVAKLKNGDIQIAHGNKACTNRCQEYTAMHGGVKFSIIDTPGLHDEPNSNLHVLKEIASLLTAKTGRNGQPLVTGAVYFHPITQKRFTGPSKLNLDVFKAICGPEFFRRVVFVTTMWETIKPGKLAIFEKLSEELRNDTLDLTGEGGPVYDLKEMDQDKIDFAVLQHFMAVPRKNHRSLLFEREILKPGKSNFKKTTAGVVIKKQANSGSCVIL